MASDDKYDRQVRLWGGHGQRMLGTCTVIMLGTGAAGTETLKNLVLPGVGNIVIVDDYMVQQSDVGNDFFVTCDSVGKSKAATICENLLELNPDVKGHHLHMSIAEYLQTHADDI